MKSPRLHLRAFDLPLATGVLQPWRHQPIGIQMCHRDVMTALLG